MSYAMILAAGRGQRMRPLTDRIPKPMLLVGGKPLIQWHIEALVAAGFTRLVINHAWLGDVIEHGLGDGSRFGAVIQYSAEQTALETAGGIAKALPLLGQAPFPVINGDVFTNWSIERLSSIVSNWRQGQLAHLVLVGNPVHNPEGDFSFDSQSELVGNQAMNRLTFSGIGVYHPGLFQQLRVGEPAKLAPLLRQAMQQQAVYGELHNGVWEDVGTPERLADLNRRITESGIEGLRT